MQQLVVERVGGVVEGNEPDDRQAAGQRAGGQCTQAEVARELELAAARAVSRQVDGRQIGGGHDRDHAVEDLSRAQPAAKCAPAALPTGTLPVAIAPTIVPSANGVRIEEAANNPSITTCSRSPKAPARSA